MYVIVILLPYVNWLGLGKLLQRQPITDGMYAYMYAHVRWNAVLLWDIWMNLIGTYLSMKVHHLTMIYDTILKSWEGQKIHWWLFQLYCTIFSYVLNEKLKSDSVLTPYQWIIAILVVENFSKNTRQSSSDLQRANWPYTQLISEGNQGRGTSHRKR